MSVQMSVRPHRPMSARLYGGRSGDHSRGMIGRCLATQSRDWHIGEKPPAPTQGTGKLAIDANCSSFKHNSGGFHIDCKAVCSSKEDWPHIGSFGSFMDTWKAPEPLSQTTVSFTPPSTQRFGLKTRCGDFNPPRQTQPLGYGRNNTDDAPGWTHKDYRDTYRTTYGDVTNIGYKKQLRRPTSSPLYGRRPQRVR